MTPQKRLEIQLADALEAIGRLLNMAAKRPDSPAIVLRFIDEQLDIIGHAAQAIRTHPEETSNPGMK